MKPHIEATCGDDSNQMVDYMLNNPPPSPPSSNFFCSNSFNKLISADTMQFEELGPSETKSCEENRMVPPHDLLGGNQEGARTEENTSCRGEKRLGSGAKSKRKRARSKKTSAEVESQRMTHIAVERNRRKQMNEHLNILRSLMPNSYIQRGDQASIIGGAIEFVRELEQLLQCLESEKRQRFYGDDQIDPSLTLQHPDQASTVFPTASIPYDQMTVEYESGIQEETAESNSCFANVQVKLIGFDGMIKILSRRKQGQLMQTIAALEDLQLHILHTSVTTIEQCVVYCFNFKMSGEARFKLAKDIADSIQQMLSFIHANNSIIS